MPSNASGQESTPLMEDCGHGWFLMFRACYKLSTDAMPWENAKKNCEVDGGYLLSVSSVAEMNLIKKEMRQANRKNTWWVGLQRAAPYSKTWVWLDSGSPFSARVTRWSPSEPNNRNGRENCVEITSDGTLSDKDCEEFRPFICERHEIHVTPPKIIFFSTIATASSTPAITTQTSSGKGQPEVTVTTMSSSGSSSLSNDAAQEDWCDPGWNAFTATCFKLFMEPKTWSDAQTYCEEMNGNLLSLNATPGLERVTKGMRLVDKQGSWWTGWHKRFENNTVIDLDARISFLNQLWEEGEPNQRYKEDCAEININGTLRDVRCNRNNNYICVKFSTSGLESTPLMEDCGTGWFLMHRACYKLSTDAMPWDSAKKNCEVDGGYLLSVSSVAEMNLIKKEMRKANRQNTWWVGLQRAAPYSKTWVWLDSGSPFSARVTRWSPSEPNNQNGRENCVEITSDGTLSDKDCEEVRPFVCERHEITPRPRLEYTTEAITSTSTTTPLTTTTITSTSTATTTVTTMSSSGSSSLSNGDNAILETTIPAAHK